MCSQCHGSTSLAPRILWLAIPAATDLVFPPAVFFSLISEPLYSIFFSAKVFPHSSVRIVLFPSFSKAFHNSLFFLRKLIPLPICQCVFSFCLQRIVVTLLAKIGRVWFLTFLYHHRRKLPDPEGLLALIVKTKQWLLRNTDRARYELISSRSS